MRAIRSIKLARQLSRLRYFNRQSFCKGRQQKQEEKSGGILQFLKDGWRQTFPREEDQIKRKYEKVKKMKRYTEEELKEMQDAIPEYQRTAMVQTDIKPEEDKKKEATISKMIPNSVKQKIKQSNSYKQYADFKESFKQFMQTSDSAAVNIGNKAYKVVSEPSTAAKATNVMRQYDKNFSVFELQKQSTFIFKQGYTAFLENDVQKLELIFADQALDLMKSLLKINAVKKVRPKYTEILHHGNSQLKKTMMTETSLPSFQFHMSLMEVYCYVDGEGKIIDGDDDRIMSSTYQFLLKYSGENIGELGHPWQIAEMQKIDEVKMLV